MPIEGTSQDDIKDEDRSESDIDSVMDQPTDSLQLPEEDSDSVGMYQAKKLRKLASYIDWAVSIRKIVYQGPDEFENVLKKQIQLHAMVEGCNRFSSYLDIPPLKLRFPYKRSVVKKSLSNHEKFFQSRPEEECTAALTRFADDMDTTIPQDFHWNGLPFEFLQQLWYIAALQKLSKKASHIGWMDFEIPKGSINPDIYIALCSSIESEKEQREMIRLREKLKKKSQYDMQPLEDFDQSSHISLLKERERIEEQLRLFSRVQEAIKMLPELEQENHSVPAFPLKLNAIDNFVASSPE